MTVTAIIECTTRFDITCTGTKSQFRDNLPDAEHKDRRAWQQSRNQQRNWETMNQIISLRCLPYNITEPRHDEDRWSFSFEVDSLAAVSIHDQDLSFLSQDAHGVPMITGLTETIKDSAMIRTMGEKPNTWFQVISNKYGTGEITDG
jgi:hypothetical protein